LIGGKSNAGNVYALNKKSGVYGPVCGDSWTIETVFVFLY
jgi:hypothetical protein